MRSVSITVLTVSGLAALLASTGCNSGSRNKNNSVAPNSSVSLALTNVALTSSQSAARIGSDVVALVFRLQSPAGSADVSLQSLTVNASGSVDETLLGGLKLISDDDGDGKIGPSEATVAQIGSPAFTQNDGSATIAATSSVTIPAGGQGRQFIVAVEAQTPGPAAAALVGKNVRLFLQNAASVATVDSAGQPGAIQGTFPAGGGPVTLFLHDHLLISEVVTMPAGAEYVEVFNPTTGAATLTNVFLTDHSVNAAPTTIYQNIATGSNFAPAAAGATDFMVRFPPGSQIQPGQTLVVAVDGTAYAAAYGKNADYCLRGAVAGVTSQQMLTSSGATWTPAAVAATVELKDAGEPVVMFYFDALVANRVYDIDYVFYGAATGTDLHVNKSGVTVSGFTYPAETPAATQAQADAGLPTPAQPALRRIGYAETGEKTTGGAGLLTGHDETSEPWKTTFGVSVPTPGTP